MSDMKEVIAARFVKKLDAQLYEIISHIICPICQELLVNPVSTPCSHSFCCSCIRKVLSKKDNCGCPLCKQPIDIFSLQNDRIKEIFSRIFCELPNAFVNDVNGFFEFCFSETAPDLLKCSKLYQYCLFIQEDSVNKRKSSLESNSSTSVNNSDTKNLLSVYKCNKSIKKYKSMKEKRLNELTSISQIEAFSPLNAFEHCELEKELGKIEKVESCQKVQEWFKAVGNDLFYSSPVPSISNYINNVTESGIKSNILKKETNTVKNETSAMIRVNYIKEPDETNDKINPYAFISSQSEQFGRSQGKNSFSRICRKNVAAPKKSSAEKKEDTVDDVVTPSQKFNAHMTEHVKNKRKIDTKNYDVEIGRKLSFPKTGSLNVGDDSSTDTKSYSISMKPFKDCGKMKCTSEKQLKRKKRLRNELRPGGCASNNCFLEILDMSSCDALELEKGMESHLKRRETDREKKVKSDDDGSNEELSPLKSTNLLCLLREIIDDEMIYTNYPSDTPIASAVRQYENGQEAPNSKSFSGFGENDGDDICQVLQNGSSDGKILKEIVATMEEELGFKEFASCKGNRLEKLESNEVVDPLEPMHKTDGEDSFEKIEKFNIEDNMRDENKSVLSIIFIKCGRLTPIIKRRKSSVVKVVFPVGLAAFGRRRKIRSPIGPSAPFLLEESSKSCRRIIRTCADTQTLQNFKSSVQVQTANERETVEVGVQTESKFWSSLQAPIRDSPKRSQVSLESVKRHSSETFSPENRSLSTTDLANAIGVRIQSEFSTPQRRKRIYDTPSKNQTNDSNKKFRENDLNEIHDRNSLFNPSKLKWIGVSMPCERALPDLETNLEYAGANKNCIEPKGNNAFLPETPASEKNNQLSESKNFAENSIDKKELRNNFIPDCVDAVAKLIDDGEIHFDGEGKEIFYQNSDTRESPPGANSDKLEESDSDFFVEQTPPRPKYSTHSEMIRQRREKASAQIPQEKNGSVAAKQSQNGRSRETNDRSSLHEEPFFQETCAPLSPSNANKKLTESQFSGREIKQTINNGINADLPAWKKFDFAPQKTVVSQEKKKFCVVASSVKNPDMVKKFASHFKMGYSNKPSKGMTHLVVGLHENEEGDVLPLCTPKLLFAMANNKWVVGEAWAEASLAANKILGEENFETRDPVGGSACRESRLSTDKILKNCQICLLGIFENILKEELENLILDAGGTLISKPNHFSYSSPKVRIVIIDKECFSPNPKQIQDAYEKFQTVILSRDFIIMSIQSWKLSNFVPYMLHSASTKDLIDMGYPPRLVVPEESTIN